MKPPYQGTLNRGTLIRKPYRVILADGTETVGWASGKRNSYATMRANVHGTWITIGKWAWHVLERAYLKDSPLRA